jgi:uncharacterized repeat protein (TIGR02543 family)
MTDKFRYTTEMPTADTSSATQTKRLVGKTLSTFHRLNPYSPQGGRYPFSSTALTYVNVSRELGDCCSTSDVSVSVSAPDPPPSGNYTLTYNGNSNTGGSAPAEPTLYSGNDLIAVLANTFTRTSRTFGGWNTVTVYGIWGLYYPAGSTLTMPYADTILYAQWYSSTGTNYEVIYDGNGSTGGTAPSTVNYKLNQGVSITANTGSLVKSGSTFYGWNTAANGLGTAYPVTSNGFSMPGQTVTLYAQWVNTSVNYTLTYNGNGNTGGTVPTTTSYSSGASVNTVLNAPVERTGYTFLGWNTAADGSGTNYLTGESIVMDSNKSLYAQWIGGVVAKTCFATGTTQNGWSNWGVRNLYRDNTNNTMTATIIVQYSDGLGAPYGTGNAFVDSDHSGNILNSYSRIVLSQVAGVYKIDIVYNTNWTGENEIQTGTISLGSTYWPTGQTIQDITITTTGFASFVFSTTPFAATSPVTTVPSTGCGSVSVADAFGVITNSVIIAFYINFSNGTTTRVAIGIQTRWDTATNPDTLTFNRTRVELANGSTPSPISGTFTPTDTTAVNTA